MSDLLSSVLGVITSIGIALISYFYKRWKSNVQNRIALLYQAQNLMRTNRTIAVCAALYPDKRGYLLDKIHFFPDYPFADFALIDDGFRVAAESYEKALVLFIAGNLDFPAFDAVNTNTLNAVEELLRIWNDRIKKHPMLYFLLPSLLRAEKRNLMQEKSPNPDGQKHTQDK